MSQHRSSDEVAVRFCGKVFRKVETETHLDMTLSVDGLVGSKSEERIRSVEAEAGRLNNSGWW